MIRLNDKGSRVILQIEIEDENAHSKFKRMYIRYNAQKLGFLGGCRPIIGLDRCHLKGRFGGHLKGRYNNQRLCISISNNISSSPQASSQIKVPHPYIIVH